MDIIGTAEDFLLHRVLGRATVAVANGAASYYLAHAGFLASWGVTVSIDPNVLSAALIGGGTILAHWIGTKIAPHAPEIAHALGASAPAAQ